MGRMPKWWWQPAALAVAACVGSVSGWLTATAMLAAEAPTQKAERGTQVWQIPLAWNQSNVTVVDTAGVCLYLYDHGIAAVPKTALPPGTGCQ